MDSQEHPGHSWPTWSREEDILSLSLEVALLGDQGVRGLLGEEGQGRDPGALGQDFESNAEYLGAEQFNKFSLLQLVQMNKEVMADVVDWLEVVLMTVFAKGVHYAIEHLAYSGYETVGLDWTIDPVMAGKVVGDKVTLQGNFDPPAL